MFSGGNRSSSAMLYRKCSGPETVLLYVDKDAGADWIWVKSGKYAKVH
jgi:hypothetical protein